MSAEKESPITPLGLCIWLLAATFFLYEFFLRTFVGSVAHQVIPDLRLNAETFAMIGSAYYIAYGLMQVPVGILADRFGVKIIMIFATLVCTVSTIMFAHSQSFVSAFVSRLLMGFGSSFAFVCLLMIAVTWLPEKFFGFFSGLSQFIGTMGPLLAGGPLITLMAKTHETWRQALTKVGLAGLALTVLIFIVIREKPRSSQSSIVFLNVHEPFYKRLLRLATNHQAWFVAIYSATCYASMALLGAIWGTEFLQIEGFTQGIAASIISIAWLGYAIACPLLGAISDIAKRRRPALIFCALLGLMVTSIITYLPMHHSTWAYALCFFALGVAAGGQNIGFATISEHTDVRTKATALGLNNGMITLSSAFIPPVVSYFIYATTISGQTALHPENFIFAFSIMPILFFISLVISVLFIKETYCKPQKEALILEYPLTA